VEVTGQPLTLAVRGDQRLVEQFLTLISEIGLAPLISGQAAQKVADPTVEYAQGHCHGEEGARDRQHRPDVPGGCAAHPQRRRRRRQNEAAADGGEAQSPPPRGGQNADERLMQLPGIGDGGVTLEGSETSDQPRRGRGRSSRPVCCRVHGRLQPTAAR
jgi:hypothetical protein